MYVCVFFLLKYCIKIRKYANGLVIDRSAIKICIVNKADKDRLDKQHVRTDRVESERVNEQLFIRYCLKYLKN